MERLVHFGQALGRSLDLDTIRDVVAQHLPKLAGTADAWVLLRSGGQWQPLVGTAGEGRRGSRAHRANTSPIARWCRTAPGRPNADPDRWPAVPAAHRRAARRSACSGFPESAGPFTEGRRRVLAAAAALLADLAAQRAAVSRAAREQPARRPHRLRQPHARARGHRHRAAPRAPLPDAGVGHHVRHRSLQGRQRSLRASVRRRGAGRGRRADARRSCAAAT